MPDDIEAGDVSERDREAAEQLFGVDYRKFPGDLERNAEIFAAHARAAAAEAVKAERERIIQMIHRARADQGGAFARTNMSRYEHAGGVLIRLVLAIVKQSPPTASEVSR